MTSKQRYISKELTHFIGKDYKSVSSDELYNRLSKILKKGLLAHSPTVRIYTGSGLEKS